MQASARDQSTPAILVIAGGLIGIVAGFLDWMDFAPSDGEATTFKGTDLTAGTGALGLGVALLVLGIILYVRGGRTGGKGVSIAVIVLAAFVLFAGGYSALSPGDALAEFESSSVAEEYDIDDDVAKAAIKAGIEAENIEVSALAGAWVATAAGLLAFVGGIMGVRRSKQIRESGTTSTQSAESPAAPPPTV